jgi:hypothetical protein
MVQPTESPVLVIYDDYELQQGAKNIWNTSIPTVRKLGVLDTAKLADNLKELCKHLGTVFDKVTTAVENYELQTVEVVIDITAKGEVKLLGSGVSGDMKGGIKLVFSRQSRRG